MDVLLWLLFGVLPAMTVMLLGVGVGGPRWLALALAVAICVPFGMSAGWPDWFWRLDLMHGDPRPALWWGLLFGGVIGTAHDFRLLPRSCALVLEFALVVLLPWLLSAPLRADWSFETCLLCLSLGWLVVTATWWGLRRAARAHPGLAVPFAMAVTLAVDAWMLRENAGGADWQLAGVAAVAAGFAVITTTWRRPFECGAGAALCMALAHTGLLFSRRSEQEIGTWPFVLAWLTPLPMWLVLLPLFRRYRGLGALLAVILVAACGAYAVSLTARSPW